MKERDIFIAGVGSGDFMVYQLLDREGAALYVGQTNNLLRRLDEHSKDKEWFTEVTCVWFEYADNYKAYRHGVYDLERRRIVQLRPRYNRQQGRTSFYVEAMISMATSLPADDVESIKAIAAYRNTSSSTVIREAVQLWLAAALAAPADTTDATPPRPRRLTIPRTPPGGQTMITYTDPDTTNTLFDALDQMTAPGLTRDEQDRILSDIASLRAGIAEMDTEIACASGSWRTWCIEVRAGMRRDVALLWQQLEA